VYLHPVNSSSKRHARASRALAHRSVAIGIVEREF